MKDDEIKTMDATGFGIICLLCLRCLNWYFVLTLPGRRGARTWLGFLRIFRNKVSSASAIRCSSSIVGSTVSLALAAANEGI